MLLLLAATVAAALDAVLVVSAMHSLLIHVTVE
jgi:hypothetical protein